LSLNRRRGPEGLSVGAAYTYQIVNNTLGTIDPFVADNRARNYNANGRRPHTLTVNYSYDVPELSKKRTTPSSRRRSTTGRCRA
jgi:hypothetical protein